MNIFGKIDCPCCEGGEMRPLTEDEKIDLLIDMIVGDESEGGESQEPKETKGEDEREKRESTREDAAVPAIASKVDEDGGDAEGERDEVEDKPEGDATDTNEEASPSIVPTDTTTSEGEGVEANASSVVIKSTPFANAKTCPECGGTLEPLSEAEREALLNEFGVDEADCPSECEEAAVEPPAAVSGDSADEGHGNGAESKSVDDVLGLVDGESKAEEPECDEGGSLLRFEERDGISLADTRGLYNWDGKPETMPSDWKGKGYFVITFESLARSCGVSRSVVTGCVAYGKSYHTISYRNTGKTMLTPILYRDRESAREVLKLHIQRHKRNGYDWLKLVNPDTVRRCFGDIELYEVLHRVIPIEEYAPRRKGEVLKEIRAEVLGIRREVSSGKAERVRIEDVDELPSNEEMARRRDQFLKEVESRRSGVNTYRTPLPSRASLDDDVGRSLDTPMIADWSKVDWDAEERESNRLEMEVVGVSGYRYNGHSWEPYRPKARRSLERWLLADWGSGKFVKIADGKALLVEKEECTYFEKLSDANGVALEIEREFWNPQYVGWRLHVVPYTEGEKDGKKGADTNNG